MVYKGPGLNIFNLISIAFQNELLKSKMVSRNVSYLADLQKNMYSSTNPK